MNREEVEIFWGLGGIGGGHFLCLYRLTLATSDVDLSVSLFQMGMIARLMQPCPSDRA